MHFQLPLSGLHSADEYFLRIRHSLGAGEGSRVQSALSHPQALGQCRHYLRERGIQPVAYADTAGVVAWGWQAQGWTRIYTDASAYPLWYLPVSVLLYLAAHDSWFYWTHRWMHRPRLFRAAHAVHHASRPPTAWAAMSFHPW